MSRKKSIIATLCLLLLLGGVFAGYEQPWLWGVERRLRDTRFDIANQLRTIDSDRLCGPGARVGPISLVHILAELCFESPLSLNEPTICDAYFSQRRGDVESRTVVYWTEKYPTPDTIRLKWKDGTTDDFPMDPLDIAENRKVARQAVLFDSTVTFAANSKIEKKLLTAPHPSVVLVGKGVELCVPYDRLGWIEAPAADAKK